VGPRGRSVHGRSWIARGRFYYRPRPASALGSPPELGYKLIAEEHGPTALVRNTVRAEQAGSCSRRFPTILSVARRTGPCAVRVLGAAAQATRHIELATRTAATPTA
jgi:hypothetical protein